MASLGSLAAPIASIAVGGVLGVTTLTGVVSSQTSAPERSPGDAENPAISYGQTSE